MARALGTDDGINECQCCGKVDLKFTVAIELDSGEVVHYGRVCASRNTGKSAPTINAEIRAHAKQQRDAASAEYRAHPAYLAEQARFAERDELARKTGARLIGMQAAEFVRESVEAAAAARAEIACRYGLQSYQLL